MQAPIVEEFAKGLGVFLIFVSARRAFDGPIDGIVYGGLVGAGFAFTENIQYFAISFIEGGVADVATTFFVRGILSPFAHVMFTSVTGFALGLAARRGARGRPGGRPVGARHDRRDRAARVLERLRGVPRLLRALHGGAGAAVRRCSSSASSRCAARRRGSPAARLGDYAAAGWFTPQEVDMLATPAGRKAALAWARTLRGDRTALMKRFILDATALAAARQRAITGRDRAPPRTSRSCSPARRTRARGAVRALGALDRRGARRHPEVRSTQRSVVCRHRRGTER